VRERPIVICGKHVVAHFLIEVQEQHHARTRTLVRMCSWSIVLGPRATDLGDLVSGRSASSWA
jgi:hypothetical protein